MIIDARLCVQVTLNLNAIAIRKVTTASYLKLYVRKGFKGSQTPLKSYIYIYIIFNKSLNLSNYVFVLLLLDSIYRKYLSIPKTS